MLVSNSKYTIHKHIIIPAICGMIMIVPEYTPFLIYHDSPPNVWASATSATLVYAAGNSLCWCNESRAMYAHTKYTTMMSRI